MPVADGGHSLSHYFTHSLTHSFAVVVEHHPPQHLRHLRHRLQDRRHLRPAGCRHRGRREGRARQRCIRGCPRRPGRGRWEAATEAGVLLVALPIGLSASSVSAGAQPPVPFQPHRATAASPGAVGSRGSQAHRDDCACCDFAALRGATGQDGQTAYAAGKAGIVGMTLPMARGLVIQTCSGRVVGARWTTCPHCCIPSLQGPLVPTLECTHVCPEHKIGR